MAAGVSTLFYLVMQPLLCLRFPSWDASLMPECFSSFVRSYVLGAFGRLFYSLSSSNGNFPQFVGCWPTSVSSVLHLTPLFFQSQSISCHYINPVSLLFLPLCISCPLFTFSEFKLLKRGLMISRKAFFCLGYLDAYGFIYNPGTGFGRSSCTILSTGCNIFCLFPSGH